MSNTHTAELPQTIARRLRSRAERLRRDAALGLQPLAEALRRRAAELELEAAILDQRLRPIPLPVRAR